MNTRSIIKGVRNAAKVLAEGIFPSNTMENQILALKSLKTLIEQGAETRERLRELMVIAVFGIQRGDDETHARLRELHTLLQGSADMAGSHGDVWNQSSGSQNDPEERLLEFLFPRLNGRNVLDVGAHRGDFTAEMLRIGFNCIHAFEPHPELSQTLAAQYRDDPRVTIHPLAVSETEGSTVLHLVERFSNDSGEVDPLLFSSLKPHNMPPGLEFRGEVPIECRSLASLAAAGVIPPQAAVLKIDAEGCDLSVMEGMPQGAPYEIIISEFWSEDFVFSSPGTPSQQVVRDYLRDHGYPHSISIIRKQDDSLCFTANMLPRTPQVWGNTLYFRDLAHFDAAYAFMSNTMPQVV